MRVFFAIRGGTMITIMSSLCVVSGGVKLPTTEPVWRGLCVPLL